MARLCRVDHFHIFGVRTPFCGIVLVSISAVLQNDSVSKGGRNFLQRLSLGFPGYRA